MNFSEKLLSFLNKRYKEKISFNDKIFLIIELDSFELVKLISDIEEKLKKKYRPKNIIEFENLNIKKFSNKKVTSETFNTDLIEEILNKLNIKTEYRVGKKRNILILKLKRSLDDCWQ